VEEDSWEEEERILQGWTRTGQNYILGRCKMSSLQCDTATSLSFLATSQHRPLLHNQAPLEAAAATRSDRHLYPTTGTLKSVVQ